MDGRGTAHYSAPEILLAEASIPAYTSKVDIWGLGVILYELYTGKRLFDTGFHVIQYYWNQSEIPTLDRSPNPTDKQGVPFSTETKSKLNDLWAVTMSIVSSFAAKSRSPNELGNVETAHNELLALLLHPNGQNRPSLDQVTYIFAAYYFTSRVRLHGPNNDYFMWLVPDSGAREKFWTFLLKVEVPHDVFLW
jgi:serine/threonine protein kinase